MSGFLSFSLYFEDFLTSRKKIIYLNPPIPRAHDKKTHMMCRWPPPQHAEYETTNERIHVIKTEQLAHAGRTYHVQQVVKRALVCWLPLRTQSDHTKIRAVRCSL